MKHWKILSLVCLLLFVAVDVHAKYIYNHKWKRKGDKMALLYRASGEKKWQQMTDFIFDANYSRSYHSWDKRVLNDIDLVEMSICEVKTSEGCGFIDMKGKVVIPCQYEEYSLRAIKDKIEGFREYFIYGKMHNGKGHLYHVQQHGAHYDKMYYHTAKRLEWEYDKIYFDESEGGRYVLSQITKPGICVQIDGKIGKVRWNSQKEQFDRILLCEYTEMKIDSISKLDLKATTPKWVTKKYESDMMVLGKNGKYGIFDGEKFVVPIKYDSTSFTIRQHSGKSAGKKKYLTQVNYIDHNGKDNLYYVMQRDGMRCILDGDCREVFAHKLRKGEDRGFDFALSGLGDIYYISADDEKMFFRLLDDSIQVNCRGGLLPKYPFDVMPDKKHTYWLMENEEGAVGLYNSKTDQMILPAEYKAIELPDQLNEVFTVTDKNGVARHAFITHDGASVVQFNNVNDLLKMSKVVKKVGKYQILKYKDAYGIYNTATKASTALNYTTVKTLGEVKSDVNPAFKNFLLTTRGTKKGLVSNDYFFNAMFDQVVLTDSAVAVTFKDWYHIHDVNSSGQYFNVKPQKMTNFIQYLKINSNGKEVTDHNILSTTLKYGDDKRLAGEIKTLAFILKNNMIQTHYELALAGWNVKQGNYNTAISQYTAVKGKLGDGAAQIDVLIEKLRDLQAQKDEKERWEAEQREMERLMAEEQRKQEEYEQQRRYIEQQRAAEARRQQKLQAWADVAAAAATMAQGINNAVQKRYNPQYRQPQVSTNRNYNAHYNQQVTNVNRAELNDAKRYYNDWVERAKSSMTRYIEADAKLKVPGISQITRTNAHQSRQREWQYLQNCLKWMRSYRNRAKQLGGNIPISQTELKVEALLN